MIQIKHLFLVASLLLTTSIAKADLVLDTPEALLKKAAVSRQDLREVVLSIQQQLPEMRDQETFESYFLILTDLQKLAEQFNLDDIYPKAVASLGKKMAVFGVKWIDLGTFPTAKAEYYFQWADKDVFGALLPVTNYLLLSYKSAEVSRYQLLAINAELILTKYFSVLQANADLVVGYREMLSNIAVTMIKNPQTTIEEKAQWFTKIYTSTGLNTYLDVLQRQIYDSANLNAETYNSLFINLNTASVRFDLLIDIKPSWLKDRFGDLAIEMIKKSFEARLAIQKESIAILIQNMSAKSIQLLSSTLIGLPDAQLVAQASSFEMISALTLPALNEKGLITEAYNLSQFLSRTSAALKIRSQGLEGQYTLIDASGKKWGFTLVSTRPIELAAALTDPNWVVFKTFFSVRYDSAKDLFTASYSPYDGDMNANGKSVISFTISGKKINIVDAYSLPGFTKLNGSMTEAFPTFNYGQRILETTTQVFKGKMKFKKGSDPLNVELILQTNGFNVNARLRDSTGPIFDFVNGHLNADGTLLMTTAQINTTWAQFRGQIVNSKLKGYIIVGGRGVSTEVFELQSK